jgi:hypothetical protein
MGRGGIRQGQGRKAAHDEIMAKDLSQKAIINKFGSLEAGMEFLLTTGEPALIKFVYEHCFGKPRDKQDVSISDQPTIQINWPDGN